MRKGCILETIILNETKRLSNNDLGYFIRTPIPGTMVPGKDGKFIFVYTAKALCDFIGIYRGRFILIEAKEVTDRFEFKRLKDFQLNQLKKIKYYGGISIIVFYLKKTKELICCNVDEYIEFKDNLSKKSANNKDLKKFKEIIKDEDFDIEEVLLKSIII